MAIDYPNLVDIQDINDEVWFDIVNRTITLKEGQSTQDVLVQNDANSRNFGFMIQRYFENEDLSTKNIRIHYINSLNQHDFASAHSIEVVGENKDVLSFHWLISAKVCLEVGNVQFAIEFYDENGYALFTTPAMVSVSKGVYTLGSIPDPDYDWVKSFSESMAGKEDKSNRVKEISNDGDDNHYPTEKAVVDFVNKSKIKIITEPCHIAELDEGIYLVKGFYSGYNGKVTIVNLTDTKVDNSYICVNDGIVAITRKQNYDGDNDSFVEISFTANGFIASKNTKSTINTATTLTGGCLYAYRATDEEAEVGKEAGIEAGKWYSDGSGIFGEYAILSDIPVNAITNAITKESTMFEVPSAKAIYDYAQVLKAEILAEINGNT